MTKTAVRTVRPLQAIAVLTIVVASLGVDVPEAHAQTDCVQVEVNGQDACVPTGDFEQTPPELLEWAEEAIHDHEVYGCWDDVSMLLLTDHPFDPSDSHYIASHVSENLYLLVLSVEAEDYDLELAHAMYWIGLEGLATSIADIATGYGFTHIPAGYPLWFEQANDDVSRAMSYLSSWADTSRDDSLRAHLFASARNRLDDAIVALRQHCP